MIYNGTTFEISYNGSSRELKTNISKLSDDTSVLYNLTPYTYNYIGEDTNWANVVAGYMADDVSNVNSRFANYDILGGPPTGIDYDAITIFTVEELKKIKPKVDNLALDIVHPLFPEDPKQRLIHSSVYAPKCELIYRGTAKLINYPHSHFY